VSGDDVAGSPKDAGVGETMVLMADSLKEMSFGQVDTRVNPHVTPIYINDVLHSP
jgi:hypothetical protein